mmetsp:Transcript_18394/g.33340  ORF Transcript_18394/g.33340 Transcript_18394/m.33340 type:complete len:213 (+) Transcript_18394:376-1014(+)
MDGHAFTRSIRPTRPSRVDKIGTGSMLFQFLSKQIGVASGMKSHKGSSKACRKVGNGFLDSTFGSSNLGCVTTQKVVHGLFATEFGHWRQDTKGIARKKNDVIGMSSNLRLPVIVNVKDWIRDASIFRFRNVEIVGNIVRSLHADIFQERIRFNGPIDIRFRLFGKINRLGIATAFKVKDSIIVPTVFIITNEITMRICRESRLSSTGESKE